ncbi:MAG: class I SAM-dependent methyltransferase [Bacteroidales bacterium]|nr:class I SAM-dependent methyltransferase [Bacteroidales bacterium]
MMEELQQCPICHSSQISEFKNIKDYFLTQEDFTVARCEHCGFLFLNPRPDKAAIAPYYKSEAYFSHSDGRKGLIARMYQIVRHFNIRNKYKLINKYKKSGKILDIGCGTGDVLAYFSANNWQIEGVEPDADARKVAQEKNHFTPHQEADLKNFPDASFDVITMWHVMEHVHNLEERMQTVRRLIKPDGEFIFSVPICDSWDAQHYGEYWAAWDVPRHLYHFSQETAKKLAENQQFELRIIKPMKFDAYYIALLSEKYKTGKSSYWKAFSNGLKSNCHAKNHQSNYSSLIFVTSPK